MKEKLKLACFSAHHADWVKGVGGTLAKYVERGHEGVNVIFAEHKEEEADCKKASEIIGANAEFLNIRYQDLSFANWNTVLRLARLIRHMKPDIVFTHWPKDTSYGFYHHSVVGKTVTMACQYAYESKIEMELPRHPIRCLLYFLSNPWTQEHLRSFVPDLYIDISDTIKKKYQAMAQYVHFSLNQRNLKTMPSLLREHRLAKDRLAGIVSGCKYAEAFKLPFDRWMKLAFDEIPQNYLTGILQLWSQGLENISLDLPEDLL